VKMRARNYVSNLILHLWGTVTHKLWVIIYISGFVFRLAWRALLHDWTKFSSAETQGFVKTISQLKKTTYGSAEYQELLDQLRPSLEHHYRHCRHHPEHFEDGVAGMTLLDVVEMYFDWKAACRRHADGDLRRSIGHNRKRFELSEEVARILMNTVEERS